MADQETTAQETAFADEEWPEEPLEELPRRPRRRLLAPVPLGLLGILLIACGFIGGVLVEKGQSTSSSSTGGTAGLASRFAALRGGSAAGAGRSSGFTPAAGTGGSSTTGTGGSAGSSGLPGGSGASNGNATVGQVAYLSGNTLYLTTTEGNTVKVTPAPGAVVTKTVTTAVKSIHPGETIIVSGTAGTNGAISAESIRVGGATGGGLGALFRGGSGIGGGARSGAGSSSSSSGPALFGNGG